MDIAAASSVALSRPGKSAQSVGHVAKAAVAEARAAGVELPKNAQGMAASAIARGADPASVFAALLAPEPDTGTDGPDTGTDGVDTDAAAPPVGDTGTPGPIVDDGATETPTDVAVLLAEEAYTTAQDILGDGTQTPAETALELLDTAA